MHQNYKSTIIFIYHKDVFHYEMDCINYFVNREMNLKKQIAHLMKAEGFHKKSVRFCCLDSFLDEQNN